MGESKEDALFEAIGEGNTAAVEALIAQDARLVEASTRTRSPLQEASDAGHVEVVRALVAAGARTHDDCEMNALMLATLNNHVDCMEALLSSGAATASIAFVFLALVNDLNPEALRTLLTWEAASGEPPSTEHQSVLLFCARSRSLALLRVFLEEWQGKESPIYESHFAVTLRELIRHGEMGAVQLMLEFKDRYESKEERCGVVGEASEAGHDTDDNLLDLAAIYNQSEICRVLLAWGADVDMRSGLGELTPLMSASAQGHLASVQVLLGAGCDLDAISGPNVWRHASQTALEMAEERGHGDVAALIMAEAGKRRRDAAFERRKWLLCLRRRAGNDTAAAAAAAAADGTCVTDASPS